MVKYLILLKFIDKMININKFFEINFLIWKWCYIYFDFENVDECLSWYFDL